MSERIRPGQLWKERAGKRVMRVTARADGNKHWYITNVNGSRRCHHIHEGTLRKFYELVATQDARAGEGKNG